MSLPAISRHLKVLERAGLVVRGRDAQWRPSRLQTEPLDEAVDWMESRKRTWEGRMDRLDAHLSQKGDDDETTPTPILITRVFDAPPGAGLPSLDRPRRAGRLVRPRAVRSAARAHPDRPPGGRALGADDGAPRRRWGFAIGYDIVELVEPELLVLRSDPMPEMGMPEPTDVRVELHDHGPRRA